MKKKIGNYFVKNFVPKKHFFEYPIDSLNINISIVNNIQNSLTSIDPDDVCAKIAFHPCEKDYVSVPMFDCD